MASDKNQLISEHNENVDVICVIICFILSRYAGRSIVINQ